MLRTHVLMLRLLSHTFENIAKSDSPQGYPIHLRTARCIVDPFYRYIEPCLIHTFESIIEYVGPQSVEDRFLISVGCQLVIRRVEAAVEGESTPLPINYLAYTCVASRTSKCKIDATILLVIIRDTQNRDRENNSGQSYKPIAQLLIQLNPSSS